MNATGSIKGLHQVAARKLCKAFFNSGGLGAAARQAPHLLLAFSTCLCGVGMSVFGTLVYRQLDHCRPDRVTIDGYELVPLTDPAGASLTDDPEAPQGSAGETKLDPG